MSDILNTSKPLQRDAFLQFLLHLRSHLGRHIGLNKPRSNRVDGNVSGGHFPRPGLW